ncbi:IS3 family transposase [Bacillus thuringiensis]|nr:IS3 family transposase [Bacillus thuringiensis]
MKKKLYDVDYKKQAVQLCKEEGQTIAQTARNLGISYKTLHRWCNEYKQSKGAGFVGSGNIKPENQDLLALKRRNRELEEELAILKKALGNLQQGPEVIYTFIVDHRDEFRVVKMCQVFGVSRSGYYAWLKRPISSQKNRKEQLIKQVRNEYLQSNQIYGSPKITKELQKKGVCVSQKTVARLMQQEGLRSITVRKYKATTNSNHPYNVYANLLDQNFVANKPNQVWMSDITYIHTDEGWVYLASIMDLYTRKIVGWHIDARMTKELVIQALKRALAQEAIAEGIIHHSDRGSQYASHEYQKILKKEKFQVSMSRKGNCYDNAVIESFHSVLKKEWVYPKKYRTREEAKSSIFKYIEVFYNRKRSHSALKYVSPIQFEKSFYEKQQSKAA